MPLHPPFYLPGAVPFPLSHHPGQRELSAPMPPLQVPSPLRSVVSLPGSPSPMPRENLPRGPSTVVRLSNIRSTPRDLLWNLFSHGCDQLNLPPPIPIPPLPDSNNPDDSIWAVFSSPQYARAALALSCDIFSITSAAESDLAFLPFPRRVTSNPPERDPPQRHFDHPSPAPMSNPSLIGAHFTIQARAIEHAAPGDGNVNTPSYTISSNPPNPKTSFRVGDWMCSVPNCSAHNFQRNTVCIACGRPRTGSTPSLTADLNHSSVFPLANPSPRFAGRFNGSQSLSLSPLPSATSPLTPTGYPPHPTASALAAAQAQISPRPPPPQYPPLTPSGRALSVGGRVRNISRDPLSPCVMYWPDNEPLPEPCQIRPIDSALITYPPIINTGNKGAAEKQPGDWLCGKCNYHNWRRRKVCQTCFPYAEGNGDSISAAVQAERIALLANVLTNQLDSLDLSGPLARSASPAQHAQSTSAPPYALRFLEGNGASVGNSRGPSPLLPQLPLSEQDKNPSPIYQTSGGRVNAPVRVQRTFFAYGNALSSSPGDSHSLLPSFLQDIVHSSSQSPSPTSSSADLSYDGSSEEAHYVLTPGTSNGSILSTPSSSRASAGVCTSSTRKGSTSSFSSLGRSTSNSIWKFDGEESKTLTASPAHTSPTTLHARGSVDFNAHDHPTALVSADLNDVDSGTTPKGTAGFWQARYN